MRIGVRPRRAGVALLALLGLLAADGGRTPAGADRATGSGPLAGCASTAFDAQTLAVPLALAVTPASVLTTTIAHPCPGPVYVEATAAVLLAPTATANAVVALIAQLTCAGGGCDVTGVPIDSASPVPGFADQPETLPATILSVPLTALFPDVPAGTYIVDVLAIGINSQMLASQAQVIGRGAAPGAGRPSP